ncbi:MAG: hypothetical protein V7695_15250, partial [Sulfitobacter sp.]
AVRTDCGVRLAGSEFKTDIAGKGPSQMMAGFRSGDLQLVTSEGDVSDNQITGEIIGEAYTGESNVYQVQTGLGSEPIILKTEKEQKLTGNVKLHLPPEKILILEQD